MNQQHFNTSGKKKSRGNLLRPSKCQFCRKKEQGRPVFLTTEHLSSATWEGMGWKEEDKDEDEEEEVSSFSVQTPSWKPKASEPNSHPDISAIIMCQFRVKNSVEGGESQSTLWHRTAGLNQEHIRVSTFPHITESKTLRKTEVGILFQQKQKKVAIKRVTFFTEPQACCCSPKMPLAGHNTTRHNGSHFFPLPTFKLRHIKSTNTRQMLGNSLEHQ